MPGTFASSPYIALPSVLSGMSLACVSTPIWRRSGGFLIGIALSWSAVKLALKPPCLTMSP